ncbi:MAG: SpoIIE family protein phosphatase [Ruminococcus sp.]|nr:SpoIIE family protein phosphatase [Ruminococcus sp.]
MAKLRSLSPESPAASVLAFAFSLGGGWLLSGTSLAGAASFGDISLSGALSLPNSAAVLAGALLRCIMTGAVGKAMVKLAAMALIVIAKLVTEKAEAPKSSAAVTAVSVLLSGAAVSAVMGNMGERLLFYAFYGALAGGTTLALGTVLGSIRQCRVLDLTGKGGCAGAAVLTVYTASLCTVDIHYINIGMILGAIITLTAAYFYSQLGGVLCGALTVCGAFLASPDKGALIALLPAAGLLTGYMGRFRAATAAGAFLVMNFLLMILSGFTEESVYGLLDIFIASAVFVLAAPFYSDKWIAAGSEALHAMPDIMSARMNFLSDSIGAVRKEAEKLGELLDVSEEKPDISAKVCHDVCDLCYRKMVCWHTEKEPTAKGFARLAAMGETSREPFPYELSGCLRKEDLVGSFRKFRREEMADRVMELRSADSRRLLFEQLRLTEEIVRSSGRTAQLRYSGALSKAVGERLRRRGIAPEEVIAGYAPSGRLLIELYFSPKDPPGQALRVCDLAADELGTHLECTEPVSSGRQIRIRLFEPPRLAVEVYGASSCASGSKENGDTCLSFNDGTGTATVVLSDGMGTGREAALESRLVVKLFRRLMTGGADCLSAVRLINSVMLTKSREEAFATLDASRFDLDRGLLETVKSGAAPTLILHGGSVLKVSAPTFPIGICQQSEVSTNTFQVSPGDTVIMFSDGISEGEYLFIKELLLKGGDLKTIVDQICGKAPVFAPTFRPDDVTVIGIRISKNSR